MQQKKNGFIMQAGILAAAGIIVRIIGILYTSPLVAIIGDEGNGYYNTAYNIYTIILLISSYSIPAAISKVIAARLAVKEYQNAHRIFMCSFLYVIIVGGIGSMVCFFGAKWLVGQSSATVLRVFAPTIFFSGLLGVLRGYFQAHRSMVQTSVSQIIEQILNAIVSISAAYLFMGMVADKDTTTQAIYGAVGSALGTGSGVVIALIFMWLVYRLNKPLIKRQIDRDRTANVLSYGEIFKIIICMVTPVVLSTFIYNFNTTSNLKIYQEFMQGFRGFSEQQASTSYGLFSGKAMKIINIPIALASAMSAAIIPTVASTFEQKDLKGTRKQIAKAIKVTMLISIPSAFGLLVLARPITMLLYPQRASVDTVAALIRVLSISVILYGLSTLTNAILQGTGRVNMPVIHAAIALLIQSGILVALLMYTNLDLYAMCIATIVYSLLMCVLNQISVRKHLKYTQEIVKTFILPSIAAAGMALVAGGCFYAVAALIRLLHHAPDMEISGLNNLMALAVSLLLAAIVYFALIIKIGAVNKKELKNMPKGTALLKVARKLHLIH